MPKHGYAPRSSSPIDLSKAGGRRNGGILLAEELAKLAWKIPIVLISADPFAFLPTKDSPRYREMQAALGIVSVIDRNSETFWKELVETLMQSTRA